MNYGQALAADALALREEEQAFTRQHVTHGQNTEALSFQLTVAMGDAWPSDAPFDAFAAEMIRDRASYLAQSIKLRELADF